MRENSGLDTLSTPIELLNTESGCKVDSIPLSSPDIITRIYKIYGVRFLLFLLISEHISVSVRLDKFYPSILILEHISIQNTE